MSEASGEGGGGGMDEVRNDAVPSRPRVVDPVDKYSAFIVRGTIVGAGLVGVALFLRNSRLFARFERASNIPREFIRKEFELKGTVREILPTGILKVEHQPMIKIPRIFSSRKREPGMLNLRLAGLDLSDAGTQFLSKDLRLRNKSVLFTVVKPAQDLPDVVDADVTLKKNAFLQTNLNVDLVRRGYARVPPLENDDHLRALRTVPAYSRLVSKLLLCEKIADRRGVGVWQRDTWVESLASYPSQITQIVRNSALTRLLILMCMVGKDTAIGTYHVTMHGYYILLGFLQYLGQLYRRFAIGVDKLTVMYNNMRRKLSR